MKVSSSPYLEKARPLLKELLSQLLKEYEYASVLATDSHSKRYSVSGSGVQATPDRWLTKRGFVVRVMDKGRYGEYAFNRLSEDLLPALLSRIRGCVTPFSEAFSPLVRPLPQDEPSTLLASTDYDIHPAQMGDRKILQYLTDIREKGMKLDSRVVDCYANVNYQENHKIFLSRNKDMEQNILWTCGSLIALALRGQEIKECYRGYSALGGGEILSAMEQDVSHVVNTALELLESQPIPPGEYDCVCSPSVTGMIVHEAFGHGVEMDMFVKDRALAASCVGQYVASPLVTMRDGAASAKETGSYFFDDEGTLAGDTVILEKGVLKTGISDLLSAQSLGTCPTGNGRRESYERKAYTRMTNTYFEGGQDKVEDMIASISYGFLLDEPSSGMEDPKNWGIQCMVNIAREIKDGKLTGRIFSPIVLTGYVPDLLKSVSMMSETVTLGGGGMCGKGYKEWVKVSDGGPYMKARIRLG